MFAKSLLVSKPYSQLEYIGFKAPKWYTLAPAIIMLIVTESALAYGIFADYLPSGQLHLVIIASLLFALGIIMAFDVAKQMRKA